MKVLLLKPYWPYPYSQEESTYNRIWPPIELMNCAAMLEKKGLSVELLDCHALRLRPDKMRGRLKGFEKIFITSSSRDRWQCPNIDIKPFLAAVAQANKVTNNVYVMGYHGTVDPIKILNQTEARAVIRGEPEETVLDLCLRDDLINIRGISYKKDGEIIHAPERELLDMQQLPVPAFHLLDFKKYLFELLGGTFAVFEISRGCKHSCVFCNKAMYGNRVRNKSLEQVLEELRTAIETYHVCTGSFVDLDFFSSQEVAMGVCHYLIKKKYRFIWACSTRADSLDENILSIMKQAGCRLIRMGVETSQERLLHGINKRQSLDKVTEIFKACKRLKIKTLAFFLFDLPNETSQDRRESMAFCKRLNPDYVSFHAMIPYLGAPVAKNTSLKPNKDIYKIIRQAYIEYYFRPSYLLALSPSMCWATIKLFWSRIYTLKE